MSDRKAALVLLLSVLGLFLCVATPVWAQDSQDSNVVLRDYYSGNGLLNRGLYELASTEYRKFLNAHGDHEKASVARYGLAVCLYRLQQYENSVGELKQLIGAEDFEFAAEVAMILGQSYQALGQYLEAATACVSILENHLDHDLAPNAALLRAESLYRSELYREAVKPCELFVSNWPEHPSRERAELFWGLSIMAMGRYEEAVVLFTALAERFPDGQYTDQSALMLAQCLHRTGSLDQALTLYERAIQAAGEEFIPDALYGLALLKHQQDRPDEAGELIDQLFDRFPDTELAISATLLRGRAWFDTGEYDKAFQRFSEIIEVEGDHLDDASYWMAKCELRLGQLDAAAQRFAQTIEQFPDSELLAVMMYDWAIALLRVDDDEAALDVLPAFREKFPDHELSPDALQLMAATTHQLGEFERSKKHCAAFRTQFSDHRLITSIDFLAAENEFLTREYEAAITEYRDFLNRHPDDSQAKNASFRLGMSLYQISNFDEAEPVLLGIIDGRHTEESFWTSLLALGDGYFQRGDWEQAEQNLSDYLSSDGEQPSTDDALLKLGLAMHRQGKREEGIEQYDRLIELHQDSPYLLQAIFERGQALVALGRDDEANASFYQVLQEDEDSRFVPHALNHLGTIALKKKQYEVASKHFDDVAEALPGSDLAAEAIFQSGQSKMAVRQFDEAEKTFAFLVEDYAFHLRIPQASALRAIALARLDRHELALQHIASVELDFLDDLESPLKASMFYEKAWCLRKLDRHVEAKIAYHAVIELNNLDRLQRYAMLELAELQADDEYYQDVALILSELLAISRDQRTPREILEQAEYRFGVCRFRMDMFDDAASTLEVFIESFPESDMIASASLLCGESLIKTGHYERAQTHLQRVVTHHASNDAYGPSLLRLGEASTTLGQWVRSEKVFAEYLTEIPGSELWFQAQFGVAWSQENQGRHEDAIESYRKVVNRHQGETAARAQFQLGECLYALKRFKEAATELLKVDIHYAYPKWSAASLYETGRCFQEMANPLEARRQFESVVKNHADSDWAQLAAQRLEEMERVSLPGHASGDSTP